MGPETFKANIKFDIFGILQIQEITVKVTGAYAAIILTACLKIEFENNGFIKFEQYSNREAEWHRGLQ